MGAVVIRWMTANTLLAVIALGVAVLYSPPDGGASTASTQRWLCWGETTELPWRGALLHSRTLTAGQANLAARRYAVSELGVDAIASGDDAGRASLDDVIIDCSPYDAGLHTAYRALGGRIAALEGAGSPFSLRDHKHEAAEIVTPRWECYVYRTERWRHKRSRAIDWGVLFPGGVFGETHTRTARAGAGFYGGRHATEAEAQAAAIEWAGDSKETAYWVTTLSHRAECYRTGS